MEYTLNCNGRLLSLDEPRVMGILNATPDSFYAQSRQQTAEAIARRTRQILDEGGSIVDVGACSTRPGSAPATEAEEMQRLRVALKAVRDEAPDCIVSVDTFRPDVARMAVEEFGADIINDVGAPATLPPTGEASRTAERSRQQEGEGERLSMFRMVSRLRVPYIYMSCRATMTDILMDCAEAVDTLRSLGQKDIVLDPGFGFGKTMEQNYQVMQQLERMEMTGLPVLVGVSRKRMVYQLLGTSPDEALNGTTVLHTAALLKGASLLRVHDVREAAEAVAIVAATRSQHTGHCGQAVSTAAQ